MKKKQILKWIFLAIAIFFDVFIILNGFLEGAASAKESGFVSNVAETGVNFVAPNTVTDSNRVNFQSFIRKFIGHFSLFAVAGIFSTIAAYLWVKDSKLNLHLFALIFTVSNGVLMAFLSEFAQLLTKDRVFSLKDVVIDSLGYLLGIIFTLLIVLFTYLDLTNRREKRV